MYQYTKDDAKHMQALYDVAEEDRHIRRILDERAKAESAYEQRKQLLKAFIRGEKDKTPVNHDLITAAGLALFANHLSEHYPVVSGFNMYVPEFYLQPLPEAIVFFDQHGIEYTTVELGRAGTPFGADVLDYLSKRDLTGIKAYAHRTLRLKDLNAWMPGE